MMGLSREPSTHILSSAVPIVSLDYCKLSPLDSLVGHYRRGSFSVRLFMFKEKAPARGASEASIRRGRKGIDERW